MRSVYCLSISDCLYELCSFVRAVPLPHHPHAGARHQRGGGRHHVRRHPYRGDHHATYRWSRRRPHRQLQGTILFRDLERWGGGKALRQ